MKKLKTAPQFFNHYQKGCWFDWQVKLVYKMMREYSRVKSDIAYEKGYQECLRQLTK